MNDEYEELKDEFAEWYYYWLRMLEDTEVATNGF